MKKKKKVYKNLNDVFTYDC